MSALGQGTHAHGALYGGRGGTMLSDEAVHMPWKFGLAAGSSESLAGGWRLCEHRQAHDQVASPDTSTKVFPHCSALFQETLIKSCLAERWSGLITTTRKF